MSSWHFLETRWQTSFQSSRLHHQLCRGATPVALEMARRVFRPLETLNRALQSSYQSVAGLINAVNEVKTELSAMWTDAVLDAMLDAVIHQQEIFDFYQ